MHILLKNLLYTCESSDVEQTCGQTSNRPMVRPRCRISSLKGRAPFCEVGGKGLWYLWDERRDAEWSMKFWRNLCESQTVHGRGGTVLCP